MSSMKAISSEMKMGIVMIVLGGMVAYLIFQSGNSSAKVATNTLPQSSVQATTYISTITSTIPQNSANGGYGDGHGNSSGNSPSQSRFSFSPLPNSCLDNSNFFSVVPLSPSNFSTITPLGWMSRGGHVIPSDHIYFQFNPIGTASQNWLNNTYNVSVYAPGNVTIYQISGQSYSGSGVNSGSDYSIYFAPCSNVSFYFHHIRALSKKLLSNYTSSTTQCGSGTINIGQIQNCNAAVSIKVKAGELLGYAGRVPGQGGSSSLDMGVYDSRTTPLVYANSSRYMPNQFHVACPIGYYPQGVQTALLAKMAVGNVSRIQPPLCGQNDYDVIGTAQGNWFSAGTPTPYFDEGKLISLARSNINYSVGAFSTGSSSGISGFSGVVYYFTPGTGLINRNFSEVTADGRVYCYGSLKTLALTPGINGVVLVQLVNANILRIEYQSSGTCSGTWGFTSAHTDLYR